MKNTMQVASEENFRDTINKYLKYWYLFVVAIVISLVLAFLYLRYATPMYEVGSSLLIKQEEKSSGKSDNASVSDLELVKSTQTVDNKIEELKSKTLLGRVINELSLNITYYQLGSVKEIEIYGKEVPLKVIIEKIDPSAYKQNIKISINNNRTFKLEDDISATNYEFGQKIRRSYGTFKIVPTQETNSFTGTIKVQFNNVSSLADQYVSKLSINSANGNTDVLKISFLTPVPQKGADVLNKLIEVANKEELEDKNRIALNTIKFIDERLKYLIKDLTGVEKSVESLKQQNSLADVNSSADMYLRQSGAYSQQLSVAETQLNVLQSLENYVSRSGNQGLVPSSLGISDATLSGLIAKYNELQLERQRILRTAQEGNPVVTNIDEELGGLRSSIRESLNNVKKGLQITRNNYRSNTTQYESKIQSVPTVERELQQIQRQQSVKQNLYLYLLQKREESTLALAATVSSSRVIDKVNVDPIPVSPKKQLVYLFAFLIGLSIPAAGIYAKNLLNNKIQNIKEIGELTDVKILGELSHSEVKGNLVVKSNSRTSISELFRLIRTNLKFHTANIDNKVILVTSTMSGEGKTFFCSNLGSTLALTDKKVVILEFDLRNPKLLSGLDVNSSIGITNYIIDKNITVDNIIKPLATTPNLFVIGAGEMPPSPAELLLHSRVEELINELKSEFDYIILDTSPVGQVADAFSLVPYSDSSIYVVRYNYTSKSQINILNEISDKLKYPMVVLNDADINNYNGYGYSYGYETTNNKRLKLIG